ncbi:hypothetical protein T492DRAFT_1063884 [Pavlovales sp. CCMP2436]|nr:hypothetical protein T492DRAFT_1063884 [Pavlovales sp. CCMP2436]
MIVMIVVVVVIVIIVIIIIVIVFDCCGSCSCSSCSCSCSSYIHTIVVVIVVVIVVLLFLLLPNTIIFECYISTINIAFINYDYRESNLVDQVAIVHIRLYYFIVIHIGRSYSYFSEKNAFVDFIILDAAVVLYSY